MTMDSAMAVTRRSLHGAAELLLAGPQHRATGRIDLRVTPGGFATVTEPALGIEGAEPHSATARVPLAGLTYTEAAAALGIEAGEPAGVYGGGPGIRPDEKIALDTAALATLLTAFADGDRALREFAPQVRPVLWPEHFDVGSTLDKVNYGVSPGDDTIPTPYAYVGPPEPLTGAFWNHKFGAARPMSELGNTAAIVHFFRTGRDLAAG
jgi:hypothetical protein